MESRVPAIYVYGQPVAPLGPLQRLSAMLVSVACLGALIVAARLPPNPSGVGTHEALLLKPCDFLARTGLPCPSCGMTTSFAWFARGNVPASLWVHPLGFVMSVATAAAFWGALYIGLSGKPALRLLRFIPARYYLWPLFTLVIAAWGWKMILVLNGLDGWK